MKIELRDNPTRDITELVEDALNTLYRLDRKDLAHYIETASPIEEVFAVCYTVYDVIEVCKDLKDFEEEDN